MTTRAARIAVTGAAGMVGRAFLEAARAAEFHTVGLSKSDLDVTDPDSVNASLRAIHPDVVVHLAAYTAVDRAEQERDRALLVNCDGASNVARAARAVNARVLHVSTDYVFDGMADTPYAVEAPANPLNVYGQSKWLGEEAVRAATPNHVVLRTSWVFAPWGSNFVRNIALKARTGHAMRVVDDELGVPTHAADLAEALVRLIQIPEVRGTLHFTGLEPVTWHAFATSIVQELRSMGLAGASDIVPVSRSEYGAPAVRPAYSVLDTASYTRATTSRPRSWRASLRSTLEAIA